MIHQKWLSIWHAYLSRDRRERHRQHQDRQNQERRWNDVGAAHLAMIQVEMACALFLDFLLYNYSIKRECQKKEAPNGRLPGCPRWRTIYVELHNLGCSNQSRTLCDTDRGILLYCKENAGIWSFSLQDVSETTARVFVSDTRRWWTQNIHGEMRTLRREASDWWVGTEQRGENHFWGRGRRREGGGSREKKEGLYELCICIRYPATYICMYIFFK